MQLTHRLNPHDPLTRLHGWGMKVLIACESSGVVREAFRARGHDAWSCDLLPADDGSPFHIQGDARLLLRDWWDLLIAHPPCTRLTVAGARWFKGREDEQQDALDFFNRFLHAPRIKRRAVENPVSVASTWIRRPDQIIQPHMFGHPEFKGICLWLENLPRLVPTNQLVLPERGSDEWRKWERIHRMPPGSLEGPQPVLPRHR